jgi:hypothetical protein
MVILRWVGFAIGVAVVAGTVASVVHTLVLPRNPGRGLSAKVIEGVWALHSAAARRLVRYEDKDRLLSLAAPAALLTQLVIWLTAALFGYALVLWPLTGASFGRELEESGSSMFTLGFALAGRPASVVADFLAAGTGLVIIALQIAYLPALYASFSRREALVTLLESRAGTPGWGTEVLARHTAARLLDQLPSFYEDWERWAADVAESHSTYPVLAYFRSPRPLDSWVTGLVAVLDSASLYLALCPSRAPPQARLCLRMGFTCMRDIADALGIGYDVDPSPEGPIALDYTEFAHAHRSLQRSGFPVERSAEESWRQFRGWRVNYEPIGYELASRLLAPPALWTGPRPGLDTPGIAPLRPVDRRPGVPGPPSQPRRQVIPLPGPHRLQSRRRADGHR